MVKTQIQAEYWLQEKLVMARPDLFDVELSFHQSVAAVRLSVDVERAKALVEGLYEQDFAQY